MGDRFPNRRRGATISDVAKLAGVTKGTVSKFLSPTPYYMSTATKERIEQAVRRLDFQPNVIAQGLANSRTMTIGVVVASVVNPFYPEMIAGVEEVIEPVGYTVLLGSTNNDPRREAKIVSSMAARQVDGIVMASVTLRDREVGRLIESGLHVVLASRGLSTANVDTVKVDSHLGAAAALEHLMAHGHSRMAHIAGPQNVLPFKERRQGFERALEAGGLTPVAIVETKSDQNGGSEALSQLLELSRPPTAVFVGNDNMALGVMQTCDRRGVKIPDDLAIIGFDNIWVGGITAKPLTTVDSMVRQIGRSAGQLLLDKIRANDATDSALRPPQHLTLRPSLVLRSTCGCEEPPEEPLFFGINRKPVSGL